MKRYSNNWKTVFLFVALLVFPFNGKAQNGYLRHLGVKDVYAQVSNKNISINMEISLDSLRIGSQDLMILTPVLTSEGEGREIQLPPIHLVGRTRAKVLARKKAFNHPRQFEGAEPLYTAVFKKGKMEPIHYQTTIPYEGWMEEASVRLLEKVSGCAECNRWADSVVVKDTLLYHPDYAVFYFASHVKFRYDMQDSYKTSVTFRVDKNRLDHGYMNNAEVLSEIDQKMNEIMQDKYCTINQIRIVGYTSPEGSVSYNKRLANRRSEAVANYLMDKFDIPRSQIEVSGYGEDWERVRDEVEQADMADLDEILDIIDTTPNHDARDIKLKRLSGGSTYAALIRDIYPRIRRTECEIFYDVEGFDVSQARETFRQDPSQLTLDELFLLSKHCRADSEEFLEILNFIGQTYPDHPVAALNYALNLLVENRLEEGINVLLRVDDNPKTWGLLGVAYALDHQYEKAEAYFTKAVEENHPYAEHNYEEFKKLLRDQRIED